MGERENFTYISPNGRYNIQGIRVSEFIGVDGEPWIVIQNPDNPCQIWVVKRERRPDKRLPPLMSNGGK